jgi:hypothetical protein
MLLALLAVALPTAALARTLGLFVTDTHDGGLNVGTIGLYTTSGKTVDSALIGGLSAAQDIAIGLAPTTVPEPGVLEGLLVGTRMLGLAEMTRRKLRARDLRS